jgi:cytochrome P450
MVTTEVYDPYSWKIQDDPYPVYAWLREHAPVYRSEQRDCWVLSRHADVLAALRDPDRYSSRNGIALGGSSWGKQAQLVSSFVAMDPPQHTEMRGLVSAAFTPRHVAELEPRIRELVRARLGPLLERGSFDFAAEFATLLPLEVICELTGVPRADLDEVRALTEQLTYRADGDSVSGAAREAGLRLYHYYTALVTDLRKHPGTDLTSALTQVRADGAVLDDGQIVGVLFLLFAAGNESTGKLLGNAWYQGALHPQARQEGLGGRADDWAAETLRYDPSGHLLVRTLNTEISLHGTVIPQDARIALLPASANRDERVFPDPDRYDLDRVTSQTIAFGHGPHYCLGAPLARLEARVVLEELGAVVADYEVDTGGAVLSRSPHGRGFTSLPCSIIRRPRPAQLP